VSGRMGVTSTCLQCAELLLPGEPMAVMITVTTSSRVAATPGMKKILLFSVGLYRMRGSTGDGGQSGAWPWRLPAATGYPEAAWLPAAWRR